MLFSPRPLLVHLFLPLAVGLPWCQALASLSTVTTAAHRAAIRPAALRIIDITTDGSKRCTNKISLLGAPFRVWVQDHQFSYNIPNLEATIYPTCGYRQDRLLLKPSDVLEVHVRSRFNR